MKQAYSLWRPQTAISQSSVLSGHTWRLTAKSFSVWAISRTCTDIRYTGKAVFETDGNYADQMIKAAGLEKIYNEQTGNKLMTFHLENASAVDIPVMGEGENLM